MKKDKTYWALEIAKLLFFGIIPVVLFIMKFVAIKGDTNEIKFAISCSGYIFTLIAFIVFKKVILKRYLAEIDGKLINYKTAIETETESGKIDLIEKALRKCLIIKDAITLFPVLIGMGFALLLVKSIECDLITLYSVLGLCAISYVLGFVCMIVQDANIKSKNRKGDK